MVDQPGCIWQVHPLYTWSGDCNVVSPFDFVGGIGLSAWGVQSGSWRQGVSWCQRQPLDRQRMLCIHTLIIRNGRHIHNTDSDHISGSPSLTSGGYIQLREVTRLATSRVKFISVQSLSL